MKRLVNKQIIVALSGSIAAYKSCSLVRLLKDNAAQVRVVMTPAATEFVTPLTLQALSGNEVHTDLLDVNAEAAMGHIQLARWADAIIIAPASADVIARLAQGRADDLLTTLCLASQAPVIIAPAMNQQMWSAAATQANIAEIVKRGYRIAGPAEGAQACGDTGPGRMLEPEALAQHVAALFSEELLQGVKILISAGATREMIDPVRFISNLSSGKMGYALARAAVEAGAQCTLISGPTALDTPERVTRIDVVSAAHMMQAVDAHMAQSDIFIACAAVSDYRPESAATEKIKKTSDTLSLTLVKNPDIVAEMAQRYPKAFIIGFAAETHNLRQHAQQKLRTKNLHMIFSNQVSGQGVGMESDDNEILVLWKDGEQHFERASKSQLAFNLMRLIAQRYGEHVGNSA